MADNEYDADPAVAAAATGPEHHPRRLLRILFGALLVAGMAAGYVAMGRQKAAKQAEAIDTVVCLAGASTSTISGRGANRYRTPSHRRPLGCAAWSETRCSIGQWPSICAGVEQPDAAAPVLLLLPESPATSMLAVLRCLTPPLRCGGSCPD